MGTGFTDSIKILEKKLKDFKGNFTLSDAAAVTGLSIDDVRTALDEMMGKYVCRLKVTENGDLIYSFGNTLQRRGAKTTAEILEQIGDWLWKAFTVFFKAWIAVTLVVYFIIFLILLLALIVAASRGDSKGRSPVKLDGLFRMFFAIFQWRTATQTITYKTDRQGYNYRHYEPNKSVLNQQKKNFIASVYDFVFGPARVERDPLNDEKEVAAYLRQEKGILTPAELVLLAGSSFSKAEEFFSACLTRFQGDPAITDEGVVYGKFDQITRRISDLEGGKIEYYWDEYEPDYPVTGNTGGRNFLIIFMNLFNLTFAALILITYYENPSVFRGFPLSENVIAAFLGWIPVLFSFLFFAVPLARLPRIYKLRRMRRQTNIRKRIMRYLFQKDDYAASLEEILQNVNKPSGAGSEKPLTREQVEDALRKMMADYEGAITLQEDGKTLYTFERIRNERHISREIKYSRGKQDSLGKVLYDSGP